MFGQGIILPRTFQLLFSEVFLNQEVNMYAPKALGSQGVILPSKILFKFPLHHFLKRIW